MMVSKPQNLYDYLSRSRLFLPRAFFLEMIRLIMNVIFFIKIGKNENKIKFCIFYGRLQSLTVIHIKLFII